MAQPLSMPQGEGSDQSYYLDKSMAKVYYRYHLNPTEHNLLLRPSFMPQTFKRMFTLIALLYFGVLIGMAVFQRHLQYFPTHDPASNLAERTMTFNHQGESLKGWILNPGKPQAIIYFGGNAEQISQNAPLFNDILSNYSVYLINYRGYGDSSGLATEKSLFDDALNIYDQIQSQYHSIAAIGRSLEHHID